MIGSITTHYWAGLQVHLNCIVLLYFDLFQSKMEDIEEKEPKVNKLKCSFSQTSGKVTIKVCRVCSKEMLLQNYSTHLKMKHPKENFKDLIEGNQIRIPRDYF